jgi:hypothetical protein
MLALAENRLVVRHDEHERGRVRHAFVAESLHVQAHASASVELGKLTSSCELESSWYAGTRTFTRCSTSPDT